jgi:hypothetical protein
VTAPPLVAQACHCTGCQTMTASAFSMTLKMTADALAVTQGEPVVGGLHGEAQHMFCDWCKSWLFTRIPGGQYVNLRPSCLDDHAWVVPYVEVFTREKLPWVTTPAKHHFEGFPKLEDYPPLVEAYAREGARPA